MIRYGQYCPIALAAEVLAERWTLLVVRELTLGGRRFNELRRGVPRMSATLLKQRLVTLRDAGIAEHRPIGQSGACEYHLTSAGLGLKPLLKYLGDWGQQWARDMDAVDLDPDFLIWNIHRRMDTERLPDGITVIEWNVTAARNTRRRLWFLCRDRGVEVCQKPPGFEVSLEVHTDVQTLTHAWRGFTSVRAEIGKGTIRLVGPSVLRRSFPGWLQLSGFAGVKRRTGEEQWLRA